jgi:Glycosyl hydrolases family 28
MLFWSAGGVVGAVRAQDAPGLACPPAPLPTFTAMLDGRPLELHGFSGGSFGIFAEDGRSEIVIRTGFDVRWVNVRPLSAQAVYAIGPNHRDISIAIKDATPLTVEFNDDLGQVVHLFPYKAEQDEVHEGGPKVHYFGPGVHDAGLIDLKPGETVYLAAGAWVKGMIRARNVRGVSIDGHGVLDGSEIEKGGGGYAEQGPILLDGTQDARIEGITIFNSREWTVHLRRANGTKINGIKILNPGAWNGDDGIDIDSSSHVVVENVFVRTNDDCVVVKNMADVEVSDIWIRHSVVWNMPNGGNGVEIGFENRSHAISDVHVEDVDMIHVERGAAISIHDGDSGVVENVSYNNIRVEDARRKLMDFAVLYAPYGPDKPASKAEISQRTDRGGTWDALLCYLPSEKAALAGRRGHIRNITVKNLQVVAGALPYSVVAGFDAGHGVENVVIDDVSYEGRGLRDAASAKLVTDYATGIVIR